ncbi:hypothetical protein GDO86_019909 [Hymenochirus boettgeri]|uniref:Uncharacterized protein n=1 Tax=Hymenochirus boettgeri TaxID=247094 RepID=A0A8T2ICB1_9PIPI|nr:hypothetical protein GDO86_019909 [Hymenochirus boettgeri]
MFIRSHKTEGCFKCNYFGNENLCNCHFLSCLKSSLFDWYNKSSFLTSFHIVRKRRISARGQNQPVIAISYWFKVKYSLICLNR